MPLFIGVDPGLSGAIAVLDETGACLSCVDTPVAIRLDSKKRKRREYALADIRAALVDGLQGAASTGVLVALEAVHAFPEQGVSTTFTLGYGFGMWCGMLGALQIPFFQVQPQRWKRRFELTGTGKQEARLVGQRRWPNVDLSKIKHDGRADSLFLAEYARLSREVSVTTAQERGTNGGAPEFAL